uniref:Sulfotransferase family cytosolic 1B member 1 n=1 Tax=Caligus clemensi TaxID=344056 RepID=C1C092_CALCM|nr:Sulfotransferase family cytosolic 1B member 1 [Caligus clemensi]
MDPIYGEYQVLEGKAEDSWRQSTLFEKPLIHFQKSNQILPERFLRVSDKIYNFETREDDVWIVSQIKSGSTWMGELTWCLLNNLDLEGARKDNLDVRMPYLEIQAVSLEAQAHLIPDNVIDLAKSNKSPRLLKTHLSFDMLPKEVLQNKNKIIYMLRNPRDVCVSMFNHYRILYDYQATFEEHVDHFIAGTGG